MSEDRPAWARRIAAERVAREWSQTEAVRALVAHAPTTLPSAPSMVRQWKRWEAGEVMPSDFYQPIIAAMFGTVTHAIFPLPGRRDGNAEIAVVSGMETLDIISRLQASDVDNATMEALRITVDRLCSEYPYMPSGQLAIEARAWLNRVVALQSQRLTLTQHREVLVMAGWLALLVGCVEYDMGERPAAESTRRAALSLATEAEAAEIGGVGSRDEGMVRHHGRGLPGCTRRGGYRSGDGVAPRSGGAARSPPGQGMVPNRGSPTGGSRFGRTHSEAIAPNSDAA